MEIITQYSVILVAVLMGVLQYKKMIKIKDFPLPEKKSDHYYLKLLPVFVVIVSVLIGVNNVLYITGWKYVSLIGIMGVIAYVDSKLHIIPNEYLLMGLIIRGICFVVELFAMGYDAVPQILADLIGLMIILVLTLLMRVMSRKGLGMGDVKLFAIMPLFLGTVPAFEAMFYSLIVSFFQAIYFLISKKKGKNDVMPFGPAIFIGTTIEIFISVI